MTFRHRTGVLLVASLVLVAPALFAAEYRGVAIGQRDDFLPPEFEPVLRGQYEAGFNKEIVQVFVEGALVTGMKVLPRAPMNLAEGLARHSSGVNAGDLRLLLDFNGGLLGLADVTREIAYITYHVEPEAVIRDVRYYNDQTSVMIFTAPVPALEAEELIAASRQSSPDALEHRPTISSTAGQAKFLVEQATEAARLREQAVVEELNRYREICKNAAACEQARATRAFSLISAVSSFLTELGEAERVYEANAELLGELSPLELDNLQEASESLVEQARAVLGDVQFARR
jgi:hypothetical protein